MSDEEPLKLCWSNFSSHLAESFHESLCRGDLVDVTLSAEGQQVKAHRLVLSVCSSYFQEIFTQMPADQHAFVFLKDVRHATLKDLIKFMYCGEITVTHDGLQSFFSTAKALQIKGLIEIGELMETREFIETGEPVTSDLSQAPEKVSDLAPVVTTSRRSRVQNNSNISQTSNKLDLEGSSNEKSIFKKKRFVAPNMTPDTPPAVKRAKNSGPFEASASTSEQQIIIDAKSNVEEAELIDLPMENMSDESDTDTVDKYIAFVEYDTNHSTENDDVNSGASGFAEPHHTETDDKSANKTQGVECLVNKHGHPLLVVDDYLFQKIRDLHWRCIRGTSHDCPSRLILMENQTCIVMHLHNHEPETEEINLIRSVRDTVVHNVGLVKAQNEVGMELRSVAFDESATDENSV